MGSKTVADEVIKFIEEMDVDDIVSVETLMDLTDATRGGIQSCMNKLIAKSLPIEVIVGGRTWRKISKKKVEENNANEELWMIEILHKTADGVYLIKDEDGNIFKLVPLDLG